MSEYLKQELLRYCENHIKKEVHRKFYNKERWLKEINYGLDDYQDMVEDGCWKLIDEIESSIDDAIRCWGRFYEYEINEELLLSLTTQDVTSSSMHCYYNEVPKNFPVPRQMNKNHWVDRGLSTKLGYLRIPLKDLINYTEKDIEELPIYSKLNEENKKLRKIIIKNYIEDLKEYIENKRWLEEDED